MIKKRPEFDYSTCISCGMCVQECPFSVLSMTLEGKQGKYRNVFPEITGNGCVGCGRCSNICPMGVIAMKEYDAG